MNKFAIHHARLILEGEILPEGYLVVEDGVITHLGAGECPVGDCEVIDAKGSYLSPGFIDLHLHGGGGHDFMDGTLEAYDQITRTHARYGTTAMVATTLTGTDEELMHTFEIFRQAKEQCTGGAALLGLHLEGPYFAYSQRGAQDPRYLKNPKREEYLDILAKTDDIVRWSVAPELPGAMELGDELKKRGIVASVGHTDAIYEQVVEAHEHGYSLMTHFYSAMSSVTRRNAYRYAGAVEAGYMLDDMDVEIIADGIHLPKSLLQFVCKFKAHNRICLVTDSMRAAGMPDGHYLLGSLKQGQEVVVEDGVAKLLDRSAFAGSVATTDRLVRTMTQIAELPLVEAIQMLTMNPARVLGLADKKGSLAVGKDADLVLFGEGVSVEMTVVKGKVVYKR